jgi:hypothetical protein
VSSLQRVAAASDSAADRARPAPADERWHGRCHTAACGHRRRADPSPVAARTAYPEASRTTRCDTQSPHDIPWMRGDIYLPSKWLLRRTGNSRVLAVTICHTVPFYDCSSRRSRPAEVRSAKAARTRANSISAANLLRTYVVEHAIETMKQTVRGDLTSGTLRYL